MFGVILPGRDSSEFHRCNLQPIHRAHHVSSPGPTSARSPTLRRSRRGDLHGSPDRCDSGGDFLGDDSVPGGVGVEAIEDQIRRDRLASCPYLLLVCLGSDLGQATQQRRLCVDDEELRGEYPRKRYRLPRRQ